MAQGNAFLNKMGNAAGTDILASGIAASGYQYGAGEVSANSNYFTSQKVENVGQTVFGLETTCNRAGRYLIKAHASGSASNALNVLKNTETIKTISTTGSTPASIDTINDSIVVDVTVGDVLKFNPASQYMIFSFEIVTA